MLRLRYLFEDYDLARAALALWPHDVDTLEDMLAQFRISSNAVYPFFAGGQAHFLRLAPVAEKLERNLGAEQAFIAYLRGNGFPALEMMPSVRGETLETVTHKGEAYFAMVSAGVPGQRMDRMNWTEDAILAFGQTLGRLHRLSTQWHPVEPKWAYTDVLRWIADVLAAANAPEVAIYEVDIVAAALDTLPKTQACYGLTHYDYELDNVFFDAETGVCHVIDFDDGMLHFYAMDVHKALDNIREEMPSEWHVRAEATFLQGYRESMTITDALLENGVFSRFAKLYGYARCLRCVQDTFAEEPDWMQDLRVNLDYAMAEASAAFGKPI